MATPSTPAAGKGRHHQHFIEEEFSRLCKRGRKHLVLSEMLQFSPKGAVIPLEMCHIGVLWVLDRKHDGRATLEDFIALADLCQRRSKCYQSFEFTAQMQGFCSLKLWQAMCGPDGQEQFVNWVCSLLLENSSDRRRFWRYGTQQYLNIDTLEVLHHLLRVQELHGADFQAFFDLLQRAGEERRMMDLKDEDQDDWVPLAVVRDFLVGAYRGAARLMSDICPPDTLPP